MSNPRERSCVFEWRVFQLAECLNRRPESFDRWCVSGNYDDFTKCSETKLLYRLSCLIRSLKDGGRVQTRP